jgi:hypothetical protein
MVGDGIPAKRRQYQLSPRTGSIRTQLSTADRMMVHHHPSWRDFSVCCVRPEWHNRGARQGTHTGDDSAGREPEREDESDFK